MPQRKGRRWGSDVLGIVLLFVIYVATALLGLRMDAVAGFATLVWPPTGISLAALLLFGRRLWPGVLLGALCANLLAGAPFPVALGIAAGNAGEALAGSWLLGDVAGFHSRLERVKDVVYLLLATAVSTALSAVVGVLSLRLGGTIRPELTWPAFRAWWLGDVLGDLVVAPVILVWISRPPLARRRFLFAEAILLAAALVGVGILIFGQAPDRSGVLQGPYMLFPVLLWAAVRFAQYGAATGTLLVSVVAIAGTAMGLGPYVRGTLAESLLYLQTFLGMASATALTVASAIAERRRAVDARDEFLAIASHELRTPLTALLLHVQKQLRQVRAGGDAPVPGETVQQLESTERMVRRLGKLIGELLEVSRIAWGRYQPERQEVDLAALVRESLSRLEEQLVRAGCPVQVAVEGGVQGNWDRDRLDRVVDNLIGNAAKYGAGKPIEVRLRGRDEDVLLEIRDYGIGIDPADQARVFERFERAVSHRQFGGFGLGLWISRKIVEAHGGSISLTSKPGAGSTFSVELPR